MASRRERYESANIRGGMGVRKRLSEESFRPTYRLNGVQRGATIAECLDRFGRWEGGYRLGTLVRKTAHWVYIKWDDEDEIAMVDQGDARYKVDREFWKVTSPRIGDPLSGERGVSLTTLAGSARIQASANADTPPTEENEDMAKEQSNAAAERDAAQNALKNGELRERETYTAKQVAYRCGTDAKTMRKFFRSKASTVEPVGQGGRYEFQATDMPKIKAEFDAWRKKADSRAPIDTTSRDAAKAQVRKIAKPNPVQNFKPTSGDHDRPTPKADMTNDELADRIEALQAEDEGPKLIATPSPELAEALREEEAADRVRELLGIDRDPTSEELEEMMRVMADQLEEDAGYPGDLDLIDFDADEVDGS